MSKTRTTLIAAFLVALTPTLWTQDHSGHDHGSKQPTESTPAFAGDPYMLAVDPVTKKKLGPVKELQIVDHDGRELRFNDEKSLRAFQAAPDEFLADVNDAIVAQQLPFYPMETCPVSGEPLGSMGKPLDILHKNRLVRLCCKGCVRRFQKEPDAIVTRLEAAAITAQSASYPLKTCITSGEALGEDGAEVDDVLIGYRLFRICCPPCRKAIVRDPLAHVARLDEALGAEKKKEDQGKKGEDK